MMTLAIVILALFAVLNLAVLIAILRNIDIASNTVAELTKPSYNMWVYSSEPADEKKIQEAMDEYILSRRRRGLEPDE